MKVQTHLFFFLVILMSCQKIDELNHWLEEYEGTSDHWESFLKIAY